MVLPSRVFEIINALYALHVDLAEGSDDERRQLTRMMAEQSRFELGPRWGTKRAGSGRPQSKDALAYLERAESPDAPQTMWIYDWQNGSTRKPFNPAGPMKDASNQDFIVVSPTNHLDADSGGGTPEPPEPPPVSDAIPYNESYAIEFGNGCNDIIWKEMPTPKVDPGMISVQSTRAAWDYYVGRMAWPASRDKHLNEFRAIYHLPPK